MKFIVCTLAVLAVAQCTPILPAPADVSFPIEFKQVVAEKAPELPTNKDFQYGFALDFSVPASVSQLQCVRQSGYGVAFIRTYNPAGQGAFDFNACQSIQNAYQAGLGIEVYMTPQPASTKQGYQQLDEVYSGLTSRGITIRSIWIQVTSPVNWPGTIQAHVNFINSIVARARQYGLSVGIYTNNYDWNQITGGWTNIGSDVMLWYWNVLGGGVNGESPANFGDFRPFGCWSAPSVKQFAQVEQVCQMTVNRDVYAINGAAVKANESGNDKIVVGGSVGF